MTKQAGCGTLVLSFDLDRPDGVSAPLVDASLATVDALLALLRDARMPATWASPRPAASDAVTEVLAEAVEHEIALRVRTLGAGQGGAHRRTREIAELRDQARQAGYSITTLLAEGAPECEMLQSVARLGVTALASVGKPTGATGWIQRVRQAVSGNELAPPQPRLLRYGLWEAPAGVHVCGGGSTALLRRMVHEAAGCGDVLHVTANVGQLQASRAGGIQRVEAILETAFTLRSEHRLAIRTVGDLVRRLRAERTSTPAESILRRVA